MPTALRVILLILLSEIWNTAGQILFKKSTNSVDVGKIHGLSGHVSYIRGLLTKKAIWVGFFFQVLCVATWIVALAQADLSFVFPIGSIQYIFILFGAHYFLGEKIDKMKFIGTLLVVAGIVIIAVS